MATFLCKDCNLSFEDDQKIKKEYHDYIFGPCWKYMPIACNATVNVLQNRNPTRVRLRKGYSWSVEVL